MNQKIGRNSPCPCGSGEKYKKCCLRKSLTIDAGSSVLKFPLDKNNSRVVKDAESFKKEIDTKEKVLLKTLTGEHFQLARINYTLFSKSELLNVLSALKCINRDDEKDRWVWLFDNEAKNIKLPKSYEDIPKGRDAIVIGAFFMPTNESLFLNINSWERLIQAIIFFEKYIPRSVAEIINIEIVNKVFYGDEYHLNMHEQYFGAKIKPASINVDDFLNDAKTLRNSMDDPEEFVSEGLEIINSWLQKPLPLIEQLPPTFYSDGIKSLEGALALRNIIATKHFSGDKDYSPFDLINELKPPL